MNLLWHCNDLCVRDLRNSSVFSKNISRSFTNLFFKTQKCGLLKQTNANVLRIVIPNLIFPIIAFQATYACSVVSPLHMPLSWKKCTRNWSVNYSFFSVQMNHFQGKRVFYLAWNVRWCVRSGSIFCSAFSCPFPGITCISFSPRLLFSKCMIIGSGRWLLTMKRGLKTIYKKKRIYHFKANFIPVLQLLKQAINTSLKWVILPLIYYMTCKT